MSDDRNIETRDAILAFTREHGYPPSMRDLAKILDLSVGGVHDRVQALVAAGIVQQVGPRKLLVVE